MGIRLAFLVVGVSVAISSAQIITSSVTGFVTDATGAAVPAAKVTLKQDATGFTRAVITDALGGYSAVAIPSGPYTVTVVKPGFQSVSKVGQVLDPQQAARIDFVMDVGAVREAITVNSSAPLLTTETAANATTITQQMLTGLPTLGGSYLELAVLSPGVVPTVSSSILNVVEGENSSGGSDWKPVSINVSGAVPDLTGFVQDGFDVRDPTYGGSLYQAAPESIQSVRITRGFDSAQYGGQPSVVYINTNSGTNRYHGVLFENNQVAALAAQPFGIRNKAPLTYNRAGGTFGGPALPRLKDKTFVFFSYQITRHRTASVLSQSLPTDQEWSGDLSRVKTQIYNPFDVTGGKRAPFPNNQIPASLLSPFAQKLRPFLPAPNNPSAPYGSVNFTDLGTQLNDDSQYLIRVDQMLPRSGHFFVQYFRDRVNALAYNSSLSNSGTAQPLRGQTASAEWDQPIGPAMVSQLRLAFFRSVVEYSAVTTSQNVAALAGLQNVATNPLFFGLPTVSVTGLSMPANPAFNLHRLTTRGGPLENLTWIHGRHSIDLGGSYQRIQFPQHDITQARGSVTYSGLFTSQSPGAAGGAGIADFLLGTFSAATGNPTEFAPVVDTAYWAAYVQDQIKVSRKLTLNFGLRWDYWKPPTERYNRWVIFDQQTGSLKYTLQDPLNFQTSHEVAPGTNRSPFDNMGMKNFSPRFGFGYLLTPNTSVRGGAGLYYMQGAVHQGIFPSLTNGGPPFQNVVTVGNDSSLLTPTILDTQLFPPPAVGVLPTGSRFSTPDVHAGLAYVEQATFTIEHQLKSNILLSLGYNGTFGHHLRASYNLNQASLLDPRNPRTLAQRRPYPIFDDILIQAGQANSKYDGLFACFEKRYSHGLNLTASYTWSKSMDEFSMNSGGTSNQNAHCLACDYALSDFDRRQTLVLAYLWELPFGSGRRFVGHGAAGHVLGHWQLAGTTQFLSGAPLNANVPAAWANVASVNIVVRPNRLCSGDIANPTMAKFFDTSCYVSQPINTFGNSGRNTITGPGLQLWNSSIARQFPIREKARLDFRAAFFSVFNHQNWNSPGVAVQGVGFGQITTRRDPRRTQLDLKLSF